MIGLIKKDSGEIELFGENVEHLTPSIKEEIGAVFDASNFSEELTPEKLDKVLKDKYCISFGRTGDFCRFLLCFPGDISA